MTAINDPFAKFNTSYIVPPNHNNTPAQPQSPQKKSGYETPLILAGSTSLGAIGGLGTAKINKINNLNKLKRNIEQYKSKLLTKFEENSDIVSAKQGITEAKDLLNNAQKEIKNTQDYLSNGDFPEKAANFRQNLKTHTKIKDISQNSLDRLNSFLREKYVQMVANPLETYKNKATGETTLLIKNFRKKIIISSLFASLVIGIIIAAYNNNKESKNKYEN